MEKSSELQSSTVCTSVSSYVGLESLLPAKEHQKLHGHADLLQWLPYFVSAAHCAGYWETYTDVAVEPVDPSNIAISPPEIQVRMDAQSFLDKWVGDGVRTILDQADDSTAFATKFLLLKSIYDPTGKITEAVVKLNDINLDDSLPASLIINKFLVFQYELAVAGVEFSDNQLLKLLLPTLRGLSQAVFDQYWLRIRDHGYSDIRVVLRTFAVYEAHGKSLKLPKIGPIGDMQEDETPEIDETTEFQSGVAIADWVMNSAKQGDV